MAKFDQNRPYGEVTPTENGVTYWQAPYHFDAQFNHVNLKGEVQERAEGTKAPPLKTKKIPTGLMIEAEAKEAEAEAEAAAPVEVLKTIENSDDSMIDMDQSGIINLLDWAKGELKGVPFFSVRKAMVEAGYDSPETAVAAKDAILARFKVVEN